MSTVSTHVLDTGRGGPAQGIGVVLEVRDDKDWALLGSDTTDADGRASDALSGGTPLPEGVYRLRFDVAGYFRQRGQESLYPHVEIAFTISGDDHQHYHVPLLLSAFGYTTYGGS